MLASVLLRAVASDLDQVLPYRIGYLLPKKFLVVTSNNYDMKFETTSHSQLSLPTGIMFVQPISIVYVNCNGKHY